MSAIFLSYRRDDAAGHTGHLYEALCESFGDSNVFRDLDNIPAGTDFAKHIEESIGSCSAVIAIIGRNWLNAVDDKGRRRLDSPRDFVRMELRAALARDVRVVPVLVQGTAMPEAASLPTPLRKLVKVQALSLTDAHWNLDVQRLVESLSTTIQPLQPTSGPSLPHQTVVRSVPALQPEDLPSASPMTGQVIRTFHAAGLDLDGLIEHLCQWLRVEQFEVQVLPLTDGVGVAIQARQAQKWRTVLGMASALTVAMRPASERLSVEIGGAKWGEKVAAGAVGVWLGVGAITPIVGAWTQKKYPEKVFGRIEQFVGVDVETGAPRQIASSDRPEAGRDPSVASVPAPPSDHSIPRFCQDCGTRLTVEARFCAGCGTRVAGH